MKYKLNAVITKSGRVITTGQNKLTNNIHYGVKKYSKELWDINRCAEKDAIQKALRLYDGLKHLAGATIYVSRFTKDGKTALAKPCKHCQELIESVGIRKVVYTDKIGTIVEVLK